MRKMRLEQKAQTAEVRSELKTSHSITQGFLYLRVSRVASCATQGTF